MLKQTITIQMQENGKFKDAFPNGIPTDSNIDKSEPGNGMTTAALEASGDFIIINPQLNTIDSKSVWCKENNINVFAVHGEEDPKKKISDQDIEEFLISLLPNKKILVTPESFPRIIKAAKKQQMLSELYSNFFCLLDESHCYASEKFREGILNPLNYVFKFKKVALGSATPFPYSNPKISSLQKYKLVYPKPFGHVNIINCNNALVTLHHFITEGEYSGNVHIFLNSVTAIGNIIASTGLTSARIHCVDNEENRLKLGNSAKYLTMQTDENFAEFNFYTCRYDEGWDMIDNSNATLIFVTDKSIGHSMQSINIKGMQSTGRLRKVKPASIFHITNNYEIKPNDIQSIEQIAEKAKQTAASHIAYYNRFIDQVGYDTDLYKLIKPYVYRSKRPYKVLNPTTVDQHTYIAHTKMEYASEKTIAEAWESRNYTTSSYLSDLPYIEIKDLSTIETKRQILDLLIKFHDSPDTYRYGESAKIFNRFKKKHHLLLQCYLLLGKEVIEELEYDNQKMKQKLITYSNNISHNKIVKALDSLYNINDNPTRAELKQLLQKLYDEYEYYGTDGKIKKATAADIELFGFRTTNGKTDAINGKRQSTLIIKAKEYSIRQVA